MLCALSRPALGLLLAVVALATVAPPAVPCGGTGGGVQGPAPTPPCVASTAIFKQNQRAIIGPYTGLTIPIWFSAQIQTSNCAPVARVEFTASLRSQATGQLVALGSTTLNGPPVGTTFGVTVGALRLVQPAIPSGIYIVQGIARVVLTNGQTFTNSGDSCLAIVDPSPNDPSLPRLDVELVNFPSAPVHAGDQMLNTYRLTNNDPVHSYTGDFIVRNRSSAGQPTIESQGDPGSEPFFVYSIAAPLQGDNFPLAFTGDLPPGVCLPLPPNPEDPAIPEIVSTVTVLPGETIEVTVVSRGWGMCSGGSGCEQVAVLDGVFDDGTDLDACAGGAVIIDDTTPPAYACDDGESGAASSFGLPSPGHTTLTWHAEPSPTSHFQVITGAPNQIPAHADGEQLGSQLRVVPVSERWARYEFLLFKLDGTPLRANVQVEATLVVDVAAQSDDLGVVIADAQLMFFPGEPFGYAEFFPFGKGMLAIDDLPTPLAVDSFFDIFFQLEAAAFGIQCGDPAARGPGASGNSGDPIPMEEFSLNFSTVPDGARFTANVVLRVPDCPEGAQAVAVAVNLKRGFARGVPTTLDCPGDTNGDNIVNFADLNTVLATFGQVGSGLAGDVNGDGIVNFADLNGVLSNFGTVCA